MKEIGFCHECKWRDLDYGFCLNNEKIHGTQYSYEFGDKKDHLVCSYQEDGAFWVGEEFGCIHWEKNG